MGGKCQNKKFKCDILGDFQTLCSRRRPAREQGKLFWRTREIKVKKIKAEHEDKIAHQGVMGVVWSSYESSGTPARFND